MKRKLGRGPSVRVLVANILSSVCLFVISWRQYSAGRRAAASISALLGVCLIVTGVRVFRKSL